MLFVHLESAIAPQVVNDNEKESHAQGLCDEDKTHETLKGYEVYKSLGIEIERYECQTHVEKNENHFLKRTSNIQYSNRPNLKKGVLTSSTKIKSIVDKTKVSLTRGSSIRQQWGDTSKEIKTIS